MYLIHKLSAMEILDSRGRPTLKARCLLKGGFWGEASVPSGASRGSAEVLELRDGDPKRFRGLGCRKAVGIVENLLNPMLSGKNFKGQRDFDEAVNLMDRSPQKSRLGGNTVLAVSLAFARACARRSQLPLYQYLTVEESTLTLPRPMINLFSGGKHAGGQIPIQDCLVIPLSSTSIADSLAMTYEVYRQAAELAHQKYSSRDLTADEGGLAPPFGSVEEMLQCALESIRKAGFEAGKDMAMAVDIAASHFFLDGGYRLEGRSLNSRQMVAKLVAWTDHFPVVSLEDGLFEEDWSGWQALMQSLGDRIYVVGDDLLCTNPERIRKASELKAANALLLKVNQIGTLTEARDAVKAARKLDWKIIASARSGETEDNWLADLAVGWAADSIKVGSITQSERLSKYNRLLEIETRTGYQLTQFGMENGGG